MNESEKAPAVVVKFKSSSQPKGQDGYELAVSSEATAAEVNRTVYLAAMAREQAQAVLDGRYTGEARAHEVQDLGTLETFEHVNNSMQPENSWYRQAVAIIEAAEPVAVDGS